jgi:hypothetical protein
MTLQFASRTAVRYKRRPLGGEAMGKWGRETVVLLAVAIPALVASAGVLLALKTTCGIVWHSRCHIRMEGIRHLDDSVEMSQLHLKRAKIRPAAMGN